jgi:Txe/YoeB family toxin of Txe-Axe toxin-antitoxin module
MNIVFSPSALEDLEHWKKSGNTGTLKHIRLLLQVIRLASGILTINL